MKKKMCIFGMVAMWVLNLLPVKAAEDVQLNTAFYEEHAGECDTNNKEYSAVGPNGQIEVYVSPEEATVVDVLANGTQVVVSFTYIDSEGTMWGLVENAEDEAKTGWIEMIYVRLVQGGNLDMKQELSTEEKSGVLDEKYAGSTIVFWDYPSVGDSLHAVLSEGEAMPQYSKIFVDELGYTWGYVDDFGGTKAKWICLDNPTASSAELYPEGAPDRGVEAIPIEKGDQNVSVEAEDVAEAEEIAAEVAPQKDNTKLFVVCGAIAGVLAVAGGLLVWLKRK